MIIETLGWFVAGICVTAFVTLWFIVSYKELSEMQKSLDTIREQVQIHRRLYMQERGGENDASAKKILENKIMVYKDTVKNYNALLKGPMNRIPGYIMGFNPKNKEGDL